MLLPQPLGPAISISLPAGREKEISSMACGGSCGSAAGVRAVRFG